MEAKKPVSSIYSAAGENFENFDVSEGRNTSFNPLIFGEI